MTDASEISCAGTRHSLLLIRLPTVSLAPAGILSIVTVAPGPGDLTLTPSNSRSLTGPLPSRMTRLGAGLRCGAGNRDDLNDFKAGSEANPSSSAGPCEAGKAATKTSATRADTPIATANLAAIPPNAWRFWSADGASTRSGSPCSCIALATASAKTSDCL